MQRGRGVKPLLQPESETCPIDSTWPRAACVPGGRLGDVGAAIEAVANRHGYGLVRDFVGHGIGRAMHEPPNVHNYGQRGRGLRLREGLVIAIEPMFTLGGDDVEVLDDGWSIVTADGSPAVHVEHTVAITRQGPRILAA